RKRRSVATVEAATRPSLSARNSVTAAATVVVFPSRGSKPPARRTRSAASHARASFFRSKDSVATTCRPRLTLARKRPDGSLSTLTPLPRAAIPRHLDGRSEGGKGTARSPEGLSLPASTGTPSTCPPAADEQLQRSSCTRSSPLPPSVLRSAQVLDVVIGHGTEHRLHDQRPLQMLHVVLLLPHHAVLHLSAI